jgi:L-amino acid N-acyltransferase YncA
LAEAGGEGREQARGSIRIRAARDGDLPAILTITNDAILNSTALYEYRERTIEEQEAWAAAKARSGWPVIVADAGGVVLGFATYDTFRDRPAYARTVEHSIYVAGANYRRGVGRQLLEALIGVARDAGYHTMIGGIDAANEGSIRFHAALGFTTAGRLREVGWKFERWLDLIFMQRML